MLQHFGTQQIMIVTPHIHLVVLIVSGEEKVVDIEAMEEIVQIL